MIFIDKIGIIMKDSLIIVTLMCGIIGILMTFQFVNVFGWELLLLAVIPYECLRYFITNFLKSNERIKLI